MSHKIKLFTLFAENSRFKIISNFGIVSKYNKINDRFFSSFEDDMIDCEKLKDDTLELLKKEAYRKYPKCNAIICLNMKMGETYYGHDFDCHGTAVQIKEND